MKKHYDVAIMGFWYGANYGSLLNGYAMYYTIKSFGKEVLMIQKPGAAENDFEITQGHNTDFVKKYYDPEDISPALPYSRLGELNDICDCFCAGSDQIWNYPISFSGMMFMPFATDDKKLISFSTSFGNGKPRVSAEENEKVNKFLHRYSAISVREQFDVDLLRDNYAIKGDLVFEPVFCIDRNVYDDLAANSDFNETEPYLLTYILDPSPKKWEAIQSYAQKLGLKIINIPDGKTWIWQKREYNLPDILENVHTEDFLKAYKGATYVITDSFHGTAFSIIFQKPFISIGNYNRGFERFTDLLGRLKLTDRLISDPENIPVDEKFLAPIDYTQTNEIIASEAKKTVDWVRYAVETPKDKLEGMIDFKDVTAKLDRSLCTGCGACINVCPTGALKLSTNHDGFFNPIIDNSKCVKCEICTKRCPALNPQYKNENNPKCFAMMAEDQTRSISSSGGMFTVAANYIIDNGGYVCGAAFTEDYSVEHIIVKDIAGLEKLRGSKYIQSNASNVYPEIKHLLENGELVLFTGMPCQVAGLYSYLNKDYDKLYTIDLFCHGITSKKVFDKYHSDVLEGKKINRLEFKAKEPWGWHAGVNAYFEDETKYSKPLETDPYYIAYLGSISKNSACENCSQNRLPRQGDISIGDFWGINKNDPELYDGKGTSAVLINNQKGAVFFDLLKASMKKWKEESLSDAIAFNHIIEHPYKNSKNRNSFFANLDSLSFEELTYGCRDNRLYEKIYANTVKSIANEDMEFYFIAKAVAKNCNGRKIVTWIRSKKFERILQQFFGLSVEFGVSMRKEALCDGIKDFSILNGKSKEYYIVSLDRHYDTKSYGKLNSYGYSELKDFIFRVHKPIVLEKYDLSKGNYYDEYGNSIEGFNAVLGKVTFKGFNNHIVLGKRLDTTHNLDISFGANGYIEIGDDCKFYQQNKFEFIGLDGTSSIFIGQKCRFLDALWRLYNDNNGTAVIINDHFTSETNLEIHSNCGKKVIVGKDCMFSHDVILWAGDGHPIFDVKTGKNINSDFINLPNHKNKLVIGNHVWISKEAFIMHGTNIGNGSIVGAKSFVKGIYPNNCSIGGNPAKEITHDIAWGRNMHSNDINQCGAENVSLTNSSKAPISGMNVLVIGGTRFMGIQLVKELIALGNNVTIATRGTTKDNFGIRVNRIKMDVQNAESVKNALSGKYFDVVFDNLAYCSVNVNNVLSNVKCGKYIQLSSVEVYGDKLIPDIHENMFNPYIYNSELCNTGVGYIEGKRRAEAIVYQKYSQFDSVTVRIPYVTPTDRLFYYCKNIANEIPMNIPDVAHGLTFIRDVEVGKFLTWIAAQNYNGPINLASEGMITIRVILDYIEARVGKKAIIDTQNGSEAPFHVYNEKTFSMNMDSAKQIGYQTSNLSDWLWKLMDKYIARALND